MTDQDYDADAEFQLDKLKKSIDSLWAAIADYLHLMGLEQEEKNACASEIRMVMQKYEADRVH
jgi:hypothetical protein